MKAAVPSHSHHIRQGCRTARDCLKFLAMLLFSCSSWCAEHWARTWHRVRFPARHSPQNSWICEQGDSRSKTEVCIEPGSLSLGERNTMASVRLPCEGLCWGSVSTRGPSSRARLGKIASDPKRFPSCCSYVYKFLYYGSFNFIRPTTCAKSQFTILHLLSCGNMYTVVAKLSIPFRETQIVLV